MRRDVLKKVWRGEGVSPEAGSAQNRMGKTGVACLVENSLTP